MKLILQEISDLLKLRVITTQYFLKSTCTSYKWICYFTTMSTYLFVYGTLMQQAENEFSLLIKKHTRFIGNAFIYAKKYNLGNYPGVKLDPLEKHKTFGELYAITNNQDYLLKNLDEYEGYIGKGLKNNLFERKVTLAQYNHKKINAWVYEYAKSIN